MLLRSGNENIVRICLWVLALSLLLVGLVSGTLVRHVIQIIPIAIVLLADTKGAKWASFAALPLFTFWMGIMILIWMFLLGMSRIANGHYTPVEILLTVVMALSSIVGIPTSYQSGRRLRVINRIFAFLAFIGLQFIAMWVSFLKPFATR